MIQNIYVIHHSHTDIGYTDLQERIIHRHIHYISQLVRDMPKVDFKWNCETYFCVERFLEQAQAQERQRFFELVRQKHLGISANYLNFTDLVDSTILEKRIAEMRQIFAAEDISLRTAMIADINGISLGAQDALLNNGIEFLYSNIHCHHGMYPLWQNQKPFFWQNQTGKKMLVWNGEHYNIGNALGLVPNLKANFMSENYFGAAQQDSDPIEQTSQNILTYLEQCEAHDYPYDFIPISVSGAFSDNAPPNFAIADVIQRCNQILGERVQLQMLTLEELYDKICQQTAEIPTYQGDLTDWWAHGVASTPYAVKHYKEAQRMYHQCLGLQAACEYPGPPKHQRVAEDNLLLFAEHTWGHSATVTDPYDDMVHNLDIRNVSYASKAHEAAAAWLQELQCQHGDSLNCYQRSGKVRAAYLGERPMKQLVQFYIEGWEYGDIELQSKLPVQLSTHPRGFRVSFCDDFKAGQSKDYSFRELKKKTATMNSRVVYVGSERVRDIENDYDPISYKLPYCIENSAFRLSYRIGEGSDLGGIYSVYSKVHEKELWLAPEGQANFFSPIYEHTPIKSDPYEERRLLGRNIRGLHAVQHIGRLKDVKICEQGPVFQSVELLYEVPGTRFCSVILHVYRALPRIDFAFRLAKELTDEPESLYLPLTLCVPESSCYIDKGGVAFRPGVDQIPGSCMEYYLTQQGLMYHSKEKASLAIRCLDAPLLYMGALKHHPIKLCDTAEQNNLRPIYAWVMNNIWETNFKMDLSGYGQFRYSLELIPPELRAQEFFDSWKNQSTLCWPL